MLTSPFISQSTHNFATVFLYMFFALPFYALLLCTLVVFAVRGHLTLKRTLSSSVSGPKGTLYFSVACPGRHMTLGYSVRGDSFRGGVV